MIDPRLDTPFAMAYSQKIDFNDNNARRDSISYDKYDLYFMGSCGIPSGHPCAPAIIHMQNDEASSPLGDVFASSLGKEFIHLPMNDRNKSLPADFFANLESRDYGACTSLVVCPIRAENVLRTSHTAGFLVVGINPRRPFDESYKLFIQLLKRQLTTSLSTILLYRKERYENMQLMEKAIKDKSNLTEQLEQQTRQARLFEQQLARVTEFSPFGIYLFSPEGKVIYVNDAWYDITQHPRSLPPEQW